MKDPHFQSDFSGRLGNIANRQPNSKQKSDEGKAIESETAAISQLKQAGQMEQALRQVDALIAKHPSQIRCYQLKA